MEEKPKEYEKGERQVTEDPKYREEGKYFPGMQKVRGKEGK